MNNESTFEFGFGRIPSPFDERDYNLRNFIPKDASMKIGDVNWEYPSEPTDQGFTFHCAGFSAANFGINKPTNTKYTSEDGHRFYYLCKEIEGKPGEETGAYLRTVGKALQKEKRISNYAFAPDVPSALWWLVNKSPLIVGTIWTSGMGGTDENNVIHATGNEVGAHAYLINELKGNLIGIQNSWGDRWGVNGKAYISIEDFEKIFRIYGEAIASVERWAR